MKIIIAHGSFGKPHENWIPWLEDELDKLGVEYLTPTFPTPAHQTYSDWKTVLDMYYRYGSFNNDTIFIGHSCGAIFLAKYIIEKSFKCKGYIGVSGYNNFINNDDIMDKLNGTFYLPDEKLANISLLAENRIAIYSNNDPFIPQSKLIEFATTINSSEIVVKNGGHINKSAGIVEFPVLLNAIKGIGI